MFRQIEPQVDRSKLRHALLTVLVAVAAFTPLLPIQTAFADGGMVNTEIWASLATNPQTSQSPMGITWNLRMSFSLHTANLVAYIRLKQCTGDALLQLPEQSTDQNGYYVDWGSNWFDKEINGHHVWATLPTNSLWFLDVHDTLITNSPSIACIPISTQDPNYWEVGNYGTSTWVDEPLVGLS